MSGNFHNLMSNKHVQITKQKMLQNTWKDAVYKVEVVQMSWKYQWGIGKDCSTNLTPFMAAEAFCLVKDICQNTGRPKPKFTDKKVEKGRTGREGVLIIPIKYITCLMQGHARKGRINSAHAHKDWEFESTGLRESWSFVFDLDLVNINLVAWTFTLFLCCKKYISF